MTLSSSLSGGMSGGAWVGVIDARQNGPESNFTGTRRGLGYMWPEAGLVLGLEDLVGLVEDCCRELMERGRLLGMIVDNSSANTLYDRPQNATLVLLRSPAFLGSSSYEPPPIIHIDSPPIPFSNARLPASEKDDGKIPHICRGYEVRRRVRDRLAVEMGFGEGSQGGQ